MTPGSRRLVKCENRKETGVVHLRERFPGTMEADGGCSSGAGDSKDGPVLGNVAEVVEKILSFVPTKSVFRLARYCVWTWLALSTARVGALLAC